MRAPYSTKNLIISITLVVISAIALTFIEPYEPLFTIVGGIYLLFIILFTIKFIRFLADYQKQQKLAQLQLLQSQIMPHFLFNTLNLIYGNQESNPDKSKETILLLSDLLRVGLYEAKKNKYSLKEEISFIGNYIKLYQHRYPDMKPVSFNINIDKNDARIVPLILFPLVENAFKHGLERDVANTNISVCITLRNNELQFSINNDFKPYPTPSQSGIGLSNLKERLNITYKNNFKVEINEDDSIYKSTLTLNLS